MTQSSARDAAVTAADGPAPTLVDSRRGWFSGGAGVLCRQCPASNSTGGWWPRLPWRRFASNQWTQVKGAGAADNITGGPALAEAPMSVAWLSTPPWQDGTIPHDRAVAVYAALLALSSRSHLSSSRSPRSPRTGPTSPPLRHGRTAPIHLAGWSSRTGRRYAPPPCRYWKPLPQNPTGSPVTWPDR